METFSQFYQRKKMHEAEIVGQEVLDSERAALAILTPYRNSDTHFVAILEGGRIHQPKTGGLVEGVPVNEFLLNGFSNWHNNMWEDPKSNTTQMALVQIIDRNAKIACQDGTSGDNPWMWKQHGNDMVQAANKMGYVDKGYESMLKNNLKVVYNKPHPPMGGSLTSSNDRPSDFHSADTQYRSNLAAYIHGTLPYSLTTSKDRLGSEKSAQKLGKLMRQTDVDIVLDRCPLSRATFVTVYNPRVVQMVKQFGIRKDFTGMERMGSDFLRAKSGQEKEIEAVEPQLNDIFAELDDRMDSLEKVLDQYKEEVASYVYDEFSGDKDELLDNVLYMIGQVDKTSLDYVGQLFWKASRLIGTMGKKHGPELGQQVWREFGKPMQNGVEKVAKYLKYYSLFLKDMIHPQEEKLLLAWYKRIVDNFNHFARACGAEEMTK